MTKDEVVSGIRKVWEFAKALEVGTAFVNPAPLSPSEEFKRSATDPDETYETLYLCGLRNSDYNIQLKDYSYFQFSITKDDHVRFAYYPNPFFGSSEETVAEINHLNEYVEEGIVTIEEYLHRIAEIRKSQHPPLLRYDNAPDQYVLFDHPCSHFHFGHHGRNRWQVERILSPLCFALIVFQQFHSLDWKKATTLSVFGRSGEPESFLSAEKVNCRILPELLLSKEERLLFTFA